jgi:hypothetical protein
MCIWRKIVCRCCLRHILFKDIYFQRYNIADRSSRSKGFTASNTAFMGSRPARGIDVSHAFYFIRYVKKYCVDVYENIWQHCDLITRFYPQTGRWSHKPPNTD